MLVFYQKQLFLIWTILIDNYPDFYFEKIFGFPVACTNIFNCCNLDCNKYCYHFQKLTKFQTWVLFNTLKKIIKLCLDWSLVHVVKNKNIFSKFSSSVSPSSVNILAFRKWLNWLAVEKRYCLFSTIYKIHK